MSASVYVDRRSGSLRKYRAALAAKEKSACPAIRRRRGPVPGLEENEMRLRMQGGVHSTRYSPRRLSNNREEARWHERNTCALRRVARTHQAWRRRQARCRPASCRK